MCVMVKGILICQREAEKKNTSHHKPSTVAATAATRFLNILKHVASLKFMIMVWQEIYNCDNFLPQLNHLRELFKY